MNTPPLWTSAQSPPTYDEAVTMNQPSNNRLDLTEQSQEQTSGYTPYETKIVLAFIIKIE